MKDRITWLDMSRATHLDTHQGPHQGPHRGSRPVAIAQSGRVAAGLAAAAVLALAAGGCGTGRTSPLPTTTVTARDFAAPNADPAVLADLPPDTQQIPPGTQRSGSIADAPGVVLTGPLAASEGILDVTAVPGAPAPGSIVAMDGVALAATQGEGNGASEGAGEGAAASADQPPAAVASVFVDAKIGDVNGKPIYATSFLEPLAARLRAEAEKMPRAEWMKFARERIREELDRFVEDELLRAEAMASLTPEQKQGLFAFMNRLGQDIQSQNYGSRERANRRLYETEGKSFDQYLEDRRQRELIQFQLAQKVYRRVNVSWRDIQLTYERFYDEFNPPPTAVFRVVQSPADDDARVGAIRAHLDSSAPFEALAKDNALNGYKPDTGGLEERRFSGAMSEAEFFANPTLNDAARALEPGQTAGPLTLGTSLYWIHLESLEQDSLPIYEAQLQLENRLRELRVNFEKNKYLRRLRDRASMTDLNQMVDRLVEIAADRYLSAPAE